jgi:carboxyl-terminal processing protease
MLMAVVLVLLLTPTATATQTVSEAWSDGFDALHDELATYYAFGEWKQIDWQALYQSFQPRIAAAAAAGDQSAYYLALRDYIYSIPDAHVGIFAYGQGAVLHRNLRFEQIGGSFGFALLELADGRVVTRHVAAYSPAAQAGIQPGAEVSELDGEAIGDALDQVSLVWAMPPPATTAIRRLQQGRFIGRAPVGTTVDVVFRNPGETEPVTTWLTAVADSEETLQSTALCANLPRDVYSEVISSEEGPVGYVRLTNTGDDNSEGELLLAQLAGAMQTLIDAGVEGIIFDLRTNSGGLDQVAANIPGHFVRSESHYEHISFYSDQTGQFEVAYTLYTEPQQPFFGGRVVAITGTCTVSSGEGVAMVIQGLEQGEVVGIYGSFGSFGITGGEVELPGGFLVVYPTGRSLDESHVIQLDSNAELEGGVVPDLLIPLSEESFRRYYIEGSDLVLQRAIECIHSRPSRPRRPRGRAASRPLATH